MLTLRYDQNRKTATRLAMLGVVHYCHIFSLAITAFFLPRQADCQERILTSQRSINATSATPVATMTIAQETETKVARSFTGTIVARRSSELGFKRIGRIDSLHCDQGDTIKKGDVLAKLDVVSLQAELNVLDAEKKAATARLNELVAGPRKQTIDAARAMLVEAQALRDQMQSTYERRKVLANSDAISQQDIDDARHQLAATEAKVQAQRQQLAELEEGTRKEQIEAQRADIARLEAGIESVRIQIRESDLIAPYDAIVSKRYMDEGAIVQPGAPILRVLETTPVEAWIGLPLDQIASLRVGETYQFSANSASLVGVLTTVLPELDPATRTQTAIFKLKPVVDPEVDAVKPMPIAIGQIVQLHLSQTIANKGYWIPLPALVRGTKGLWSVYLVVPIDKSIEASAVDSQDSSSTEWTLLKTDVEVIQVDSDRVLVAGMLKDGDRIVTSGVQKLTAGQLVQLMDSAPTNE